MKRILPILSLLLILLCIACEKESLEEASLVGKWNCHLTRRQHLYHGAIVEEHFMTYSKNLWEFEKDNRGQSGKGSSNWDIVFDWQYDREFQKLSLYCDECFGNGTFYHVRWESIDRVVLSTSSNSGLDSADLTVYENYLER